MLTEEQIVGILNHSVNGISVPGLTRKLGISEAIFYCWKRYNGTGIIEFRQLKIMDGGNLKYFVADLNLDNAMF